MCGSYLRYPECLLPLLNAFPNHWVSVLQDTDPILILPLSLGCLQYGALSAFTSLFLGLLV